MPYPQIVEYHEAVQHPSQAFTDPELKSIGITECVPHPTYGHFWQVSPLPRFSRSQKGLPALGPSLGEHTVGVLAELGYDQRAIDAAIVDKVVR